MWITTIALLFNLLLIGSGTVSGSTNNDILSIEDQTFPSTSSSNTSRSLVIDFGKHPKVTVRNCTFLNGFEVWLVGGAGSPETQEVNVEVVSSTFKDSILVLSNISLASSSAEGSVSSSRIHIIQNSFELTPDFNSRSSTSGENWTRGNIVFKGQLQIQGRSSSLLIENNRISSACNGSSSLTLDEIASLLDGPPNVTPDSYERAAAFYFAPGSSIDLNDSSHLSFSHNQMDLKCSHGAYGFLFSSSRSSSSSSPTPNQPSLLLSITLGSSLSILDTSATFTVPCGTASLFAMHLFESENNVETTPINTTIILSEGGILNISRSNLDVEELGYGVSQQYRTSRSENDDVLSLDPTASDGALLSIVSSSHDRSRIIIVNDDERSLSSSFSSSGSGPGSGIFTGKNRVNIFAPMFSDEPNARHLFNVSNSHWTSESRVGLVKLKVGQIDVTGDGGGIVFGEDDLRIDGGGTSYGYQFGADDYHFPPASTTDPLDKRNSSSLNSTIIMQVNISGDGALLSVSPSRIIIWNNHTIFGITSISTQWSVRGGGRLLFGHGLPWSKSLVSSGVAPGGGSRDSFDQSENNGGDGSGAAKNWTLGPDFLRAAATSIGFLGNEGTKFFIVEETSELAFFSGLVYIHVGAWSPYNAVVHLQGVRKESSLLQQEDDEEENEPGSSDLTVHEGARLIMGGKGASWQVGNPLGSYDNTGNTVPEQDIRFSVNAVVFDSNFTLSVSHHSTFEFIYGTTPIECALPAKPMDSANYDTKVASHCRNTALHFRGVGSGRIFGLSLESGSSLLLFNYSSLLIGDTYFSLDSGSFHSPILNVGLWSSMTVSANSMIALWNISSAGPGCQMLRVTWTAKFTLEGSSLLLASNVLLRQADQQGHGVSVLLNGEVQIENKSSIVLTNFVLKNINEGTNIGEYGYSLLGAGLTAHGDQPADQRLRFGRKSAVAVTGSSSILLLQNTMISTFFKLGEFTDQFFIDQTSSLTLEGNFMQSDNSFPMVDLAETEDSTTFYPEANSSFIFRCNWVYDGETKSLSQVKFEPPFVAGSNNGGLLPVDIILRYVMGCSDSCLIGPDHRNHQDGEGAMSFCFNGGASTAVLNQDPILPFEENNSSTATTTQWSNNYSSAMEFFRNAHVKDHQRPSSSRGSSSRSSLEEAFQVCHCSKCPESAVSYPVAPGPFCLPLLPAPTPLHPTWKKHAASAPTQAPNLPQAPPGSGGSSLKTWMIVLIVLGSLLLFACLLHIVLHGVAILFKKKKQKPELVNGELEKGLLNGDQGPGDSRPYVGVPPSEGSSLAPVSPTKKLGNVLDWSVRPTALNFRKGKLIGSGGFGRVYIGLDDISGRLLAAKEINLADDPDREAKARELDHEIDMMRQLDHANVVQYLGADQLGPCEFYIFMEFLPGGSLRSIINSFGSLNQRISAKYTLQALEGLRYLHSRRVVHRDIKSANMLLDRDGVLKLADMGSAQSFTSVASMRGTPYWMAPEVIKVGCDIGPASDVWSLGGTVVEMLTGRIPFEWLGADYQVMNYLSMLDENEETQNADSLDLWTKAPDKLKASKLGFDFVKHCCQLNPKKRPIAEELLEHPFILLANTSDYFENSARQKSREEARARSHDGDTDASSSSGGDNNNSSRYPSHSSQLQLASVRNQAMYETFRRLGAVSSSTNKRYSLNQGGGITTTTTPTTEKRSESNTMTRSDTRKMKQQQQQQQPDAARPSINVDDDEDEISTSTDHPATFNDSREVSLLLPVDDTAKKGGGAGGPQHQDRALSIFDADRYPSMMMVGGGGDGREKTGAGFEGSLDGHDLSSFNRSSHSPLGQSNDGSQYSATIYSGVGESANVNKSYDIGREKTGLLPEAEESLEEVNTLESSRGGGGAGEVAFIDDFPSFQSSVSEGPLERYLNTMRDQLWTEGGSEDMHHVEFGSLK